MKTAARRILALGHITLPLLVAGHMAVSAASAATVFDLTCQTLGGPFPSCPINIQFPSAQLTFAGTVPLDGTIFSGPASFSASIPGLSGSVMLPSRFQYYYGESPFHQHLQYFAYPGGQPIPAYVNFIDPTSQNQYSLNALTLGSPNNGNPYLSAFLQIGSQATPGLGGSILTRNYQVASEQAFGGLFVVPFTKPQTVFLDFDAHSDARFSGFNQHTSIPFSDPFSKESSGLNQTEKAQVVAAVQGVFDKFLVNITQTRPSTGDYHTVYVGGEFNDLPMILRDHLTGFANANGLAHTAVVDQFGQLPSGNALVFTGKDIYYKGITGEPCSVIFCFSGAPSLQLMADDISHEIGHMLGLRHVVDPNQLMYPLTPDPSIWDEISRKAIGPVSTIAEVGAGGNVIPANVGETDADAILSCYVGLRASQEKDCSSPFARGYRSFGGLAASLSGILHEAKLYIIDPTVELPFVLNLGMIDPASDIPILIPYSPGDEIFLVGSSIPGGAPTPFELLISGDINNPGAPLTLMLEPENTSVSEPRAIFILILTIAFLTCARSSQPFVSSLLWLLSLLQPKSRRKLMAVISQRQLASCAR